MKRVISMRIQDERAQYLKRIADRYRWSVSETASRLLDEKMREMEHPMIEFRDSLVGRQAYVKGSSLAVWEVAWLASHFDNDVSRLAEYLGWPEERVAAALAYANAYRREIDPLVEEADAVAFERLQAELPWLRKIEV